MKLFYEQKMKLDYEEKRAQQAADAAAGFYDALRETREVARMVATEVKHIREGRTPRSSTTTPRQSNKTSVFTGGGNLFEGFSLALPTPFWAKKEKQVTVKV